MSRRNTPGKQDVTAVATGLSHFPTAVGWDEQVHLFVQIKKCAPIINGHAYHFSKLPTCHSQSALVIHRLASTLPAPPVKNVT